MKRARKVFGRVRTEVAGVKYRFELRKSGIHIRRKHARKLLHLSFADAISAAEGQLRLL